MIWCYGYASLSIERLRDVKFRMLRLSAMEHRYSPSSASTGEGDWQILAGCTNSWLYECTKVPVSASVDIHMRSETRSCAVSIRCRIARYRPALSITRCREGTLVGVAQVAKKWDLTAM